ncbi:MAG: recombinase zinc beta ribbon domain-containing protein [Emergencia sp.]
MSIFLNERVHWRNGQFKTYTNSIWDKKQRRIEENRVIFYNTHPAIIEQEVFDKVQEIRQQRHRRTATGKSSPFSGLVFCADCKQKLYYSTTKCFEKRQDFFTCSTHRANKDKCSGHYIRAVVLEDLVWNHMKEVISYVTRYEAHFRVEMEQKLRLQSEETIRVYKKRLAQAEKRIGSLTACLSKSTRTTPRAS